MYLNLRCGCPPDRVMFDSPCKTRKEIVGITTASCITLVTDLNYSNDLYSRDDFRSQFQYQLGARISKGGHYNQFHFLA